MTGSITRDYALLPPRREKNGGLCEPGSMRICPQRAIKHRYVVHLANVRSHSMRSTSGKEQGTGCRGYSAVKCFYANSTPRFS